MPYPVLPPEPPAIIQPLTAETLSHSEADGLTSPKSANQSRVAIAESANSRSPQPNISAPNPSTSVKKAAPLGSPLTVEIPTSEPSTSSSIPFNVNPNNKRSIPVFAPSPRESIPSPSSYRPEDRTKPSGLDQIVPNAYTIKGTTAVSLPFSQEKGKVEQSELRVEVPSQRRRTEETIKPQPEHQTSVAIAIQQPPEPLRQRPPIPNTPDLQQIQAQIDTRPSDVLPDLNLPTTPIPELPTTPVQLDRPLETQIVPFGHIVAEPVTTPTKPQAQRNPNQPPVQPSAGGSPTNITTSSVGVMEVVADRQQFDEQRRIFTAEGNVTLRFQGGLIEADRLQGNLNNLIAVGEGNTSLVRGQQTFRGDRFVYNFLQDTGTLQNVRGTVFSTTSGPDFTFTTPTGQFTSPTSDRPLSDRLLEDQPPIQVSPVGGVTVGAGTGGLSQGGTINRIRFEAEQVDFYPRGWTARNIRVTNDPFSPPELELRANRAVFTQLSPLKDELVFTNPRYVFDQGLSVPNLQRRVVIDRSEREPPIAQLRYDDKDRGGFYVERTFNIFDQAPWRLTFTPQLLAQRAVTDKGGNIFNPGSWGFRTNLFALLTPTTRLRAEATVYTLNISEWSDKARAGFRVDQIIGTTLPHTLTVGYSYRQRFFNGSLGYQTVENALGGVLVSPNIPLGTTGINLTYQAGLQYISANSDRLKLFDLKPLEPIPIDEIVSLPRFQVSAELRRPTLIWRGQPLPATPSQGLRYTPTPVVPFVQVVPAVRGTANWYSEGYYQQSATFSLFLQAQFGHFSKPFLDYTGINLGFIRVFHNGLSPFYFDRVADDRIFVFGVTQQIYGPIRIGFQSSVNLDSSDPISTNYTIEYSRRTYKLLLRFNPQKQEGSFNLLINDFNWTGGSPEFGGSGGRFIDSGVVQDY